MRACFRSQDIGADDRIVRCFEHLFSRCSRIDRLEFNAGGETSKELIAIVRALEDVDVGELIFELETDFNEETV